MGLGVDLPEACRIIDRLEGSTGVLHVTSQPQAPGIGVLYQHVYEQPYFTCTHMHATHVYTPSYPHRDHRLSHWGSHRHTHMNPQWQICPPTKAHTRTWIHTHVHTHSSVHTQSHTCPHGITPMCTISPACSLLHVP